MNTSDVLAETADIVDAHQVGPNGGSLYPAEVPGPGNGGGQVENSSKQNRSAENCGEGNEPPAKRFRASGDIELRFLISSKSAGGIIGKSGSNINHLRKHYKSNVTIPDCPGPERVLSILTKSDCLADMLGEVLAYMADDRAAGQKNGGNSDREAELRLLVHTSHAGGIIGRQGQRIRELREQTKAAIKVFSQCCPQSSERVCALQGTPTIVIQAVKVVLDLIGASPIKGAVQHYDPFKYDPYAINEYGGFDELPPGAPQRRAGPSPVPSRSARPYPGQPLGPGQRAAWDRAPLPPPPPPPPGYSPGDWRTMQHYADAPLGTERRGPSSMYSRAWGMPESSAQRGAIDATPYWDDNLPDSSASHIPLNSHPPPPPPIPHGAWWANHLTMSSGATTEPSPIVGNLDGSTTATLTVPNNICGAIIGKGGNRIRMVRRDSGAEISIDSSSSKSSADRTIYIRGNQDQVREAYRMLQRSIAEHSH